MSKPKVEAIFPLTLMQQALLIHSLQQQHDEGFLQVSCMLEGRLDRENFERAWRLNMDRHEALRASVHWEKIEQPVWVVHAQAELSLAFYEWQDLPPAERAKKIDNFKVADRNEGLDLRKAPSFRVTLIQTEAQRYLMLWSCHHLLLDGWSAAVVFEDLFHFYAALVDKKDIQLEALPSYRTFHQWSQKRDRSEAEAYWKDALGDFEKPSLVTEGGGASTNDSKPGSIRRFSLSKDNTAALQSFIRKERITLNTLIQGALALLLGKYLSRKDILIGMPVSGRSAPIPNLNRMTGMFSNMMPFRSRIDENLPLIDWLQTLQKNNTEAGQYDYVSLTEINSWIDWSGSSPLFDTLLIFNYFPWQQLAGGDLIATNFSGGLTTTYPLTIVVSPGSELKIQLRYEQGLVPEKTAAWLEKEFHRWLVSLVSEPISRTGDAFELIAPPAPDRSLKPNNLRTDTPTISPATDNTPALVPPQNLLELQLSKIWEQVFAGYPIGVTDNFFELGGNSIQAVQLFTHIKKQLGQNLSPAALIQQPTIRSIAKLLEDGDAATAWDYLVPLRTSGDKCPLFCVHAGGGHVFFYKPLADKLGPNQPVYAIQAAGTDGGADLHDSIEAMAADYLREIRSIQPEGPYQLLGTCFSNLVVLEMAQQLAKEGQSVGFLAIVDSAPKHPEITTATITPKEEEKSTDRRFRRLSGFSRRLRENPKRAIQLMIQKRLYKLEQRLNRDREEAAHSNTELSRLQQHLADLYGEYECLPLAGKITLFRSSEYSKKPGKDFHLEQWSEIALEGLEVSVVPGHHRTLFQEPEVSGLAEAITKQLKKSSSETTCGPHHQKT